MGVNFTAIIITILGSTEGEDDMAIPPFSMWIVWALCVINPFIDAAGIIAMRKMAKFNDYTVGWYMNVCSMLLALACLAPTKGADMFDVFPTFDWKCWVMVTLAGICTILQQVFKFKSLQYQKASALQIYYPLTTLWQFLFDLFLFNLTFSTLQYIGFGILFAAYGFQIAKYFLYDRRI